MVAVRADVVAYIAPIVYPPPLASEDHVDIAVVGGGASAVLLVAALRREAGDAMPSVAVIDPADTVGPGVAYSTIDAHHRMNVRASGLSTLADDPDHFVKWLAAADPSVAPHQFAHRYHYGQYLAEMFEQCAGDEVTHIRATVAEVELHSDARSDARRDARSDVRRDAVVLHLDNGKSLTARRVVLAIGVPPTASARFTVDVASGTGVYVPDPWAPGAVAGLIDAPAPTDGVVALVGTGLTSVDLALSLSDAGWDLVAVSPHGQLPERHEVVPSPAVNPPTEPPNDVTAASFIHWVRTMCVNEPSGWRAAMDQLRFRVAPVWQRTPPEHRRRLMRRVGSVWQRHRHRIAPDVAETIDALISTGRLRLEHGRVVGVVAHRDQRHVVVQRVGGDGQRGDDIIVDAVVNCAGAPGIAATTSVLTRRLLDDGVLVPDDLGLGVEVAPDGQVVGVGGTISAVVTVLGALRRGVEVEAIAIPELRVQASTAARRLVADMATPPAA